MTAHVLITGAIFRAPEQRTSKAGKPFVSATMKVKDGEGSQFWRVLAFAESVQAEILRLRDGDALSVQGALRAETYQTEGGETKLSLSIIANSVLVLRPLPKECKQEPKAVDGRTRQECCAGRWSGHSDGPNDRLHLSERPAMHAQIDLPPEAVVKSINVNMREFQAALPASANGDQSARRRDENAADFWVLRG